MLVFIASGDNILTLHKTPKLLKLGISIVNMIQIHYIWGELMDVYIHWTTGLEYWISFGRVSVFIFRKKPTF